jgi:hypothetical protein
MFVLIFILVVAGYILYKKPEDLKNKSLPDNLALKLDKLWRVAQEAIVDKKYLRAEKILLTILRFDEKNATAYNRLGIIYAGQKNYDEAIECFEIAQSLENSPSSLHNVGLIYLETYNFKKAALAFEQALSLEDSLPTRHIAYAKALEGLGKEKAAILALEKAVEKEARPQTLKALGSLYLKTNNTDKAQEIKEKLDSLRNNRLTIKQNRLSNSSATAKKIEM